MHSSIPRTEFVRVCKCHPLIHFVRRWICGGATCGYLGPHVQALRSDVLSLPPRLVAPVTEPDTQGVRGPRHPGGQVQELEPGVAGQRGEPTENSDPERKDGPDGHRRVGEGPVPPARVAGGERAPWRGVAGSFLSPPRMKQCSFGMHEVCS